MQMLKDEMNGWFNLFLGVSMFFFAALIGEIGRIGDWLFKKKD
jgi:uncharacterized membrane protein